MDTRRVGTLSYQAEAFFDVHCEGESHEDRQHLQEIWPELVPNLIFQGFHGPTRLEGFLTQSGNGVTLYLSVMGNRKDIAFAWKETDNFVFCHYDALESQFVFRVNSQKDWNLSYLCVSLTAHAKWYGRN